MVPRLNRPLAYACAFDITSGRDDDLRWVTATLDYLVMAGQVVRPE